jgi:hypothetical protein
MNWNAVKRCVLFHQLPVVTSSAIMFETFYEGFGKREYVSSE